MDWAIRPLDGIGPLRFGMTPAEVGRVLDAVAPISGSSLEDGGLREVRGLHTPICHYKAGKLFHVDTHVHVPNVTIFGQDVYSSDPLQLLQLLEEQSGGAQHWHEFISFDRIGIITSCFYSIKEAKLFGGEDYLMQDDRGIAVYQPGPDTFVDGMNMTPISFLNWSGRARVITGRADSGS